MEEADGTVQQRREQLLRLVSKTFYRELVEYGVAREEILTVANHLLDNVLGSAPAASSPHTDQHNLSVSQVQDEWAARRTLTVKDVSLRPVQDSEWKQVAQWLQSPEVRNSFVPALPESPRDVFDYFAEPGREYLGIHHEDRFVGVIGAENIDTVHDKLEMKKLIGSRELRGRGIGTRATFAFLYQVFVLRKVHKVFIHSFDTNVRNLNLNSRMGFELEGIFLEEYRGTQRRLNVVRMSLLRPIWLALFEG